MAIRSSSWNGFRSNPQIHATVSLTHRSVSVGRAVTVRVYGSLRFQPPTFRQAKRRARDVPLAQPALIRPLLPLAERIGGVDRLEARGRLLALGLLEHLIHHLSRRAAPGAC